MSGTYTVCNDVTCDFQSISEAVDSLVSQTMDGPVILLLGDSTITEQVTIPYIEGSSAINTLTIRPANEFSGNQPVHILFTATSVDEDFVIAFDSAQYVILQNIDIRAMDSDFATCLMITNGTRNVSIDSCSLNSQETSTSGVLIVNDILSDSLSVSNSLMLNGGYGMILTGNISSYINNMRIFGNDFINNSMGGINAFKVKNISLSNNYFKTNNAYPGYIGIYFINVSSYTLDRNYLYLKNGTGMSLTYSGTYTSLITNNIIYISGVSATDDIGISIGNGSHQYVCFNTVVIDSISSNLSSALSFPSTAGIGNSNFFLNNNLNNFAGGYVISVEDTDPSLISACNFNNIFGDQTTLTNYLGTDYDSLANWQLATGLDSNSVSVNPFFVDTTFIMYCAPELENAGTPFEVDHDFGNYMRDTLTPDIGAIEKNITGWSLIDHSAERCDNASYTIDAGTVNYGSYNWSNGSTDRSIEVTEDGWYYVTVTDGCTEKFDSLRLIVQDCNPVRIHDNSVNYDITVMPNPAKDNLIIQFENPVEATIEVVTLQGRVVVNKKIESQNLVDLDLRSLSSGVYILKINAESYNYRKKFIKQE